MIEKSHCFLLADSFSAYRISAAHMVLARHIRLAGDKQAEVDQFHISGLSPEGSDPELDQHI